LINQSALRLKAEKLMTSVLSYQELSGRSAARMTLGREFPALALSICEAGS